MIGTALAALTTSLYGQPADSVRSPAVMFWNLECYFDPFDDPATEDDEFTPRGRKHWTWKQFTAKRDGIAKTIASASSVFGNLPDIVALAEVENRMVLKQLTDNTILLKAAYGIVHRESPDKRGIDVALLYRKKTFRVLEVQSLKVESDKATRDILYVKGIFLKTDTLHLFVNHWPSKLGGATVSGLRRAAAAQTLNRCVDSILNSSGRAFIAAMGDFNDTPENISPLVTERLSNLSETLFRKGKGTIKYQGEWELIDQFFCTEKKMRMEIFSPAFLLETDKGYTGMKPRRTFTGPRNHGGLSDHLPILLMSEE